MEFPLLLVVPALVIDLAYARWGRSGRDWMLAAVSGVGFVLAMLAAHWPFGEFLLSPASRNWVFATHRFYYAMPMSFPMVQHRFMDLPTSLASFATSIGIAMVFATLAARFGLAWGGWMARVQR